MRNKRVLYALAILHALVVPVRALFLQILDKYLTHFPGAMVLELLRPP